MCIPRLVLSVEDKEVKCQAKEKQMVVNYR